MRPAKQILRRLMACIVWIAVSTAVGACVFLACVDVCFGIGIYSHYAFPGAAGMGAMTGAIFGLFQCVQRLRSWIAVALAGFGPALVVGSLVLLRLSQVDGMAEDHSKAVFAISTAFLYSLCAGLLTGVALVWLPRWYGLTGSKTGGGFGHG